MKYNVSIPKPSAKRMAANKKIIITFIDWEGDIVKEHNLDNDVNIFEFEIKNEYIPIRTSTIMDGACFKVEILYTNSTKSRSERIELVPLKIA